MAYLEDLSDDFRDFGINKVLTVRSLSIDWKHRDSELHLRESSLLFDLEVNGYSIKNIYRNRSNQLRYIYHIPRSVFRYQPTNDLVCNFRYLHAEGIHNFPGNIFLDFEYVFQNVHRLNRKLIEVSNIFSFKFKQQDIIKFFVKNNIPLPKNILLIQKREELNQYLESNLSMIVYGKETLSDIELKYYWCCNYHLYEFNDFNNFSRTSFKTDTALVLPRLY